MEAVKFEQDDMLRLLTDALRRGPGSPEWRDAMEKLRDATSPDVDEYQLLLQARENIELGKSYREVRAGPGFTRQLMEKIDAEGNEVAPMRLAPVVAVVSGLAILLAISWVGFKLWGTPPADDRRMLTDTLFANSVKQANFENGITSDWKMIHPELLDFTRGLHLVGAGKTPQNAEMILLTPLDASKGLCVEAAVVSSAGAAGQSVQIVLSDVRDMGSPSEPAELVAVVDPSHVSMLLSDGTASSHVNFAGQTTVRIRLNDRVALVEAGNQTIYSGPHLLRPGLPKFVGIRLLSRGEPAGELAVKSLTVLKP